MDGVPPAIAGVCSLLRTRELGVSFRVAQRELKPGFPLTDTDLSHRNSSSFPGSGCCSLWNRVPLSSPASHVSLWLSLSLPFLVPCRPSPAWMDQGVCAVNGMMPFLWRALTNSFSYSCPVSTLVGLLCYSRLSVKNVQIKVGH